MVESMEIGNAMRFRFLLDPLFLLCVTLYVVNRFLLKPFCSSSFVHNHLNDAICIPFWVPIMLWMQRCCGLRGNERPSAEEIIVPLACWSWVFEIILPQTELFRDLCVRDSFDVVWYAVGAVMASVFWRSWYGRNEESGS